jgi:hypothetical protein
MTAPARRARATQDASAEVNGRAHVGGHVEGVDDVLDAERHAGKHTLGARAINCARLVERDFGIDKRPRLDLLVAFFDPLETIAHHGFRGERTAGHPARDLAGRQFVETVPRHHPLAALPAAVPAILPNTEPDVSPVPPG